MNFAKYVDGFCILALVGADRWSALAEGQGSNWFSDVVDFVVDVGLRCALFIPV